MIKVLEFRAVGETTLIVSVEDEHRSDQFEFYYDKSDIPRVTWNRAFEKTFLGRFSDAEPLLKSAMHYFKTREYSFPVQIKGELRM